MSRKIALVHDQLTQYGGAERVLDIFHNIYPSSPIYTTVYIKDKLPEVYGTYDIRTTIIDKISFIKNTRKLRTVLFTFSIRSFNLSEYDLILSDTQGIAKGVKKSNNQKHICYVHTIPWAVWNLKNEKGRFFTKFFGQKWDYKTAQSPDTLIANSEHTKFRIGKYWNRDSVVIYPPVEVTSLQMVSGRNILREDYVVFVGRVEGYKKEIELAQACTELKINLKIVGSGKNIEFLKSYSGYVEVIENADFNTKAEVLSKARCSFNGSLEDFGINMAESLAVGTPVLALGEGGATEIIENKVTGLFIYSTDVESIKKGLLEIFTLKFDKIYLQNSVNKFSKETFIQKIQEVIDSSN